MRSVADITREHAEAIFIIALANSSGASLIPHLKIINRAVWRHDVAASIVMRSPMLRDIARDNAGIAYHAALSHVIAEEAKGLLNYD